MSFVVVHLRLPAQVILKLFTIYSITSTGSGGSNQPPNPDIHFRWIVMRDHFVPVLGTLSISRCSMRMIFFREFIYAGQFD
jgi:hypothetical protein